MTQDTDTTPPSPDTARSATERNVLPHARPVLLGTYLGPAGNRALLRTHDGRIRMVGLGDHVNQATITMIEAGRLHLTLLNQVHELTIPGTA